MLWCFLTITYYVMAAQITDVLEKALRDMASTYAHARYFTTPPKDLLYWNVLPLMGGDMEFFDQMVLDEEERIRVVSHKIAEIAQQNQAVEFRLQKLGGIAKNMGVSLDYAEFEDGRQSDAENFVDNGLRFAGEICFETEKAERSLLELKRLAEKTGNALELELETDGAAGSMAGLRVAATDLIATLQKA